MSANFPKDEWRARDISRPLTSVVTSAALLLIAALGYYRGLAGAVAGAEYVGGIACLIAIYLTYRWQWPRLARYIRDLWRRY